MLRILASVALSLSLASVAACSSTPPERPPLEGADIGGPFELIDKAGQTVRWSDFAGKYRVVYFGYTFCPDVCPTDMARTARGFAAFAKEHPDLAKDVAVMFITVDPERDTPEKVGEFAGAFSPDIIGLTGSQEQVDAAKDAFRVFASKGETSPGGGYLVNHSNITYLFDRDGKPLATLPTDQGAEAVAAELDKWVR